MIEGIFAVLIYIVIGIAAGIFGGLLGIGGGSVTVPALLAVFTLFKFPQTYVMHLAIGTSLASMVVNTFAAARAHHLRNGVKWSVVKRIIPGVIVGSLFGAFTAHALSGIILEILFGFFACAIGLSLLKKVKFRPEEKKLPSLPLFSLMGAMISCIANILGIGGGVFLVPLFIFYNMNEKYAIGTSVAITFLISLAGAIAYLFFGLQEEPYKWSLGYIYLPAFFAISISSYFAAPYGAKLAHTLPTLLLRRIFAAAMITVGLLMIFT